MLQRTGASRQDHVTLAILMRIVGALFVAIMGAFTKQAGMAGANPGEILFFRSAMALPVIILWIMTGPGFAAVRTNRPKAHLSRAVLGVTSMSMMFYAFSLLPLTEALTIFFISPLIATCLAALLLRDSVGIHRWIAIGIGFLGVLVVMQPGDNMKDISTLGLIVAAFAALLMACVTITLRQLGSTENAAATVFWFTVLGTIVMSCAYPFFYQPHPPLTWIMMAGVGISGAIIQITNTASLQLAPVSATAPFDYTQLFWAALIGWLIWADLPAWSTVAGGLLIAGAGLYTFYRERMRRQSIAEEALPAM
jgi:drug/metabolite transporter (DMT)-like permease